MIASNFVESGRVRVTHSGISHFPFTQGLGIISPVKGGQPLLEVSARGRPYTAKQRGKNQVELDGQFLHAGKFKGFWEDRE